MTCGPPEKELIIAGILAAALGVLAVLGDIRPREDLDRLTAKESRRRMGQAAKQKLPRLRQLSIVALPPDSANNPFFGCIGQVLPADSRRTFNASKRESNSSGRQQLHTFE